MAGLTQYKVTVKVSATIRPTGELRLVQVSTQGVVKNIAVKENQLVQQGDIIATIDDSRLQTQKSQLQSNLKQNQQQLKQIDAQRIALDGQIAAERERTQRAITSAQAELEETQRDYQDRTITTQSQVQEAEANLKQAQQELQKTRAQLKSAQAGLKSSQAGYQAAIAKRDRYEPISKTGALSKDQYEEVKLLAAQQEQNVESQKAIVEQQQQDIKRLTAAVDGVQARLKGVLAAVNPSKAKVEIAQQKIPQERAMGEVTLSRLNQEHEQLIQKRLELQNQLNRDGQELEQITKEAKKTVIRASASGTIQQLNLRNIDQVVNAGDAIAQIAPSEAPLVIKALVPSEEIAKLKIGQQAQMRVSACPYPDYGTLIGKVSGISPDASNPQGKDNANLASASYILTIQPDRLELKSKTQSCMIQSGMEGRADIITKEETVLTFVLRKTRLMSDF